MRGIFTFIGILFLLGNGPAPSVPTKGTKQWINQYNQILKGDWKKRIHLARPDAHKELGKIIKDHHIVVPPRMNYVGPDELKLEGMELGQIRLKWPKPGKSSYLINGHKIDFQNKVFDRFTRSESSGNMKGTGLGLTIAKQLLEAMSGSIWFDTQPGKGTTFHFTLPQASQT